MNNWITKRLDEVATITMGQSPPSSSYNTEGAGVPFLQGTPPVVDGMGAAVPNQWTTQPTKIVEAGTALMTVRAPVGELFTSNGSVCLGRGLAGIRANNGVSQDYLNYYLQFAKNQFAAVSQGSTFTAINSGDLKGIEVALPSFQNQEYFGKILFSIDQEIAKTNQIIQKTELLKKGVVAKIVDNNSKSQKYKIKGISEVTSSKRVMVSDYVKEGVPFYRSTEIIKKSKNIPVTDPLYISFEKFNSFKDRFGAPQEGDLLITAVGTIGDVYLVKNETFYFKDGNTVWIRKLKDFVLPEYLKMILASSFYRERLNSISGGSSQKALTIQKLENVEVPIPSDLEQKRIVDILSSIDGKISINQNQKGILLLLKQGLMQDIFSRKVEVN